MTGLITPKFFHDTLSSFQTTTTLPCHILLQFFLIHQSHEVAVVFLENI